MTQAIVIMLAAIIGMGALLRAQSWWIRHVVTRTFDRDSILLSERGCSMRVLVQGTRSMAGMSTHKANRTTGDLVLAADRFVLVTSRGLLADLRPDQGRRFSSVRCTGPGRLVIEGTVPTSRAEEGRYRVELRLNNAAEWVEALAPWVDAESDFTSF